MRVIKSTIRCSNCGKIFDLSVKVSSSSRNFGLDGKPDNADFLPDILECPNCGYAGYKIDGPQPVIPDGFSVDKNNPYDLYERAILVASSDDVKNHLLMEYAWRLEFDGKKAEALAVRERAVNQIELSLSKKPIIELAFIYIDFLRQLGRFNEAELTLDSISSVVEADAKKKPQFYKLYKYLRKLIAEKDAAPHMINEV